MTTSTYSLKDAPDVSNVIYMISKSDGSKRYIGKTCVPLRRRARNHVAKAIGQPCGSLISKAIRKHGHEAFHISILERCERANLDEAERRHIFISKPEYNLTEGGGGCLGYTMSAESREKMAAAKRGKVGPWAGKKRAASTVEKMRERLRLNPINYWAGKSRSEETRKKISASKTGNPLNHKPSEKEIARLISAAIESAASRRLRVVCVDNGREYESISFAAKSVGVNKGWMSKACKSDGKYKVHGMRFSYVQ